MPDHKKILIIEDEAFLSDMYRTKFESLGYIVATANNGTDGLTLMRQQKPDLILLDIIMPVMDGYSVLRIIRHDPEFKRTLVVIFSNLGQDDEVTKGMQLGADDYLIKSNLTPTELVQKMETTLVKGFSDRGENLKKIRVLLIEDTKDLIDLYVMRFESEGFIYKVAENGVWGLKTAQSEEWDVILLDIMMPEMNGLDALKMLRATPKLAATPIIVFSNSIEDEGIAEVRKAGATDVFLKARVTPTQIVNRIREVVKIS